MNRLKDTAFYISLGLIPVSILFKILNWPGGASIFALGIFGLTIYLVASLLKNLILSRKFEFQDFLQTLLVFMSFALFTRYLYYRIGDYPSLIVVPIFIGTIIFGLIKKLKIAHRYLLISIIYGLLTIPLFITGIPRLPRPYLPDDLTTRYTIYQRLPINFDYQFENTATKELSSQAFDLRESDQLSKSIEVYNEARLIEPYNPQLLFDLSEAYAKADELERAIELLDTAIMIDNQNYAFYTNRGILHYKLKQNDKAIEDYLHAISIEPDSPILYSNLALVYYYEEMDEDACKALSKAVELGHDVTKKNGLKMVKRHACD